MMSSVCQNRAKQRRRRSTVARMPLIASWAIIIANQISPAATCSPWQLDARTQAAVLSMRIGNLESLQFGAAFLAVGPQQIYRVAVHQLSQLRKCLVRCEIRVDNHSNDYHRLFDYGGA